MAEDGGVTAAPSAWCDTTRTDGICQFAAGVRKWTKDPMPSGKAGTTSLDEDRVGPPGPPRFRLSSKLAKRAYGKLRIPALLVANEKRDDEPHAQRELRLRGIWPLFLHNVQQRAQTNRALTVYEQN